jgi:hypothetical protein
MKEALSIKFGGLEELGEKMCIIGELGKLLLEEIPLEETPPGYGRARYTGYDKTENAVNEATKCVSSQANCLEAFTDFELACDRSIQRRRQRTSTTRPPPSASRRKIHCSSCPTSQGQGRRGVRQLSWQCRFSTYQGKTEGLQPRQHESLWRGHEQSLWRG